MSTELTEVATEILKHVSEKYTTRVESPGIGINIPELPEKFTLEPDDKKPGKFYYGVRIVTGDQAFAAASDIGVYFQLTGRKYTTGKVSMGILSAAFHDYFSRSSYDDILIECEAELVIDVFAVGLQGLIVSLNHWYVDFMQTYDLQNNNAVKTFACFHWVGSPVNEISCTSETSTYNDIKSNPVIVQQRRDQLATRVREYNWKVYHNEGLPSSIDDSILSLPADEQFETAKMINFLGNGITGIIGSGVAATHNVLSHAFEKLLGMPVTVDSVSSLDKYEHYATQVRAINEGERNIDEEVVVYEGYRWVSDVEFGRQILNGVNPVIIKKCTVLPANFPVTDEMVQNLMPQNSSLSEQMKIGRVFICDLSSIMDGLHCREGYYCSAPICLLHVNSCNQLVPIAIQLQKEPGPENPIFLPTDRWMDWLLAKICYKHADGELHQLCTHFTSCHAAMEAYGVAVMRNLPDAHPIHKLLRRHFRYTMSINTAARTTLINDGGPIDMSHSVTGKGKWELIERYNRGYSVHLTNIKRSIKERGVEDVPGYYYRDDGIKIWDAIEVYVSEIINLFYSSDEDVKNDPELQNWAYEVHNTAFPAFQGNDAGRGFPDKFTSRSELIEYCTLIIFTGSAQHAAVNFGQFDIYGYGPNSPLAIRQPPPKNKGTVDYALLLKYLPDIFSTILTTALVSALVQYSPDEIFLGGYPLFWFVEDEAKKAEQTFLSSLKKIEAKIIERNKSLDIPYEYLLPTRVPNSVTI